MSNRITTRQLTQNGLHFVAEISDFGYKFELTRVYPDAMDIGFILESAKTGAEVTMVMTKEVLDSEHDVVAWEFEPTADSVRHMPSWAKLIRVTLLND